MPRSARPCRPAPFGRVMLVMALMLVVTAAGADGGSASPPPRDPLLASARQAIERRDFAAAVPLLHDYLARQGDDADGWNWLGYAERQRGRLPEAFAAYDQALQRDPNHRGAHEYLGEAHLQDGNLAAAETQLAALDRLCWLPCREYRDLKEAIAAYKARGAAGR